MNADGACPGGGASGERREPGGRGVRQFRRARGYTVNLIADESNDRRTGPHRRPRSLLAATTGSRRRSSGSRIPRSTLPKAPPGVGRPDRADSRRGRRRDLIVLATPVDAIPLLAVKALNRVGDRQVVIDMGSIKSELCEVISMHARRGAFRGRAPDVGHGGTRPGRLPSAGLTGRNVVFCDTVRSDSDAPARRGADLPHAELPGRLHGPEEHDLHAASVAYISHVTSFALALTVLEKEREERHIFDLAGGGLRVRCAWRRVPRRRGSGSCCITSITCWMSCASISTSCRSCARCFRTRRRRGAEVRHGEGEHHPTNPSLMTTAETGRVGGVCGGGQPAAAGLFDSGAELAAGTDELDLVATDGEVLHIVEVKTRQAGSLTPPEAAATRRKFRALTRAARCYLRATGWTGEVQFDLASVEIGADGAVPRGVD